MLPFDKKPWARPVAATVIALTLIAAVCVPIILHYRKALDPPIVVTIILLLFAIIPPNIAILRQHRKDRHNPASQTPPLYAPPANH
jgi:hypothetical protein